MNSITEATYSGIPLICVALFTDQPRNCLMGVKKGTAVTIKKNNITKDSLVHSFRTIIEDQSFNENAKELARMIASKPMKVDERVLKHAEFAAVFDVHKHLDIYGRHLNFIEFYNIDAIAVVFLTLILVFYILYRIVRLTIRLTLKCFSRKSKSKFE